MLERLRPAHAAALAIFGATLLIVLFLTIAQSIAFDDIDGGRSDVRITNTSSAS